MVNMVTVPIRKKNPMELKNRGSWYRPREESCSASRNKETA